MLRAPSWWVLCPPALLGGNAGCQGPPTSTLAPLLCLRVTPAHPHVGPTARHLCARTLLHMVMGLPGNIAPGVCVSRGFSQRGLCVLPLSVRKFAAPGPLQY